MKGGRLPQPLYVVSRPLSVRMRRTAEKAPVIHSGNHVVLPGRFRDLWEWIAPKLDATSGWAMQDGRRLNASASEHGRLWHGAGLSTTSRTALQPRRWSWTS